MKVRTRKHLCCRCETGAPVRASDQCRQRVYLVLSSRAGEIRSPDRRAGFAAAAQVFARSNFHPRTYADQFLKFAGQVQGAKPSLRFADRLATELHGLGITADMDEAPSIVDRVTSCSSRT